MSSSVALTSRGHSLQGGSVTDLKTGEKAFKISKETSSDVSCAAGLTFEVHYYVRTSPRAPHVIAVKL